MTTTTRQTARRQSGQMRRAATTTTRYRQPATGATPSQASQIATTAPDLQRRRDGWRVLRQLRAASAELTAAIVTAARHNADVSVRVAPIADGEAPIALASLPAKMSDIFAPFGVVTSLSCADVWGDPRTGALTINAAALDALRAAEVRLDDALLSARLTRPGNRYGYTVEAQVKALATLADAIAQARHATQRAQTLSYDALTVARLVSIASRVLPTLS